MNCHIVTWFQCRCSIQAKSLYNLPNEFGVVYARTDNGGDRFSCRSGLSTTSSNGRPDSGVYTGRPGCDSSEFLSRLPSTPWLPWNAKFATDSSRSSFALCAAFSGKLKISNLFPDTQKVQMKEHTATANTQLHCEYVFSICCSLSCVNSQRSLKLSRNSNRLRNLPENLLKLDQQLHDAIPDSTRILDILFHPGASAGRSFDTICWIQRQFTTLKVRSFEIAHSLMSLHRLWFVVEWSHNHTLWCRIWHSWVISVEIGGICRSSQGNGFAEINWKWDCLPTGIRVNGAKTECLERDFIYWIGKFPKRAELAAYRLLSNYCESCSNTLHSSSTKSIEWYRRTTATENLQISHPEGNSSQMQQNEKRKQIEIDWFSDDDGSQSRMFCDSIFHRE
jgi:hypothetical protein